MKRLSQPRSCITICLKVIRNAWHFCYALGLAFKVVCGGLRDLCNFKVEGEGYRLSYRIIRDNLELGISCISDSCNPIELTRREWHEVAESVGAKFINIEISCSDSSEHEQRVITRRSEVTNLKLPDWKQVQNRHYEAWKADVIKIDTAGKSIEIAFAELTEKLGV
ncbi:DUF3265 domain-containing protein [Vibrio alginolyticus]|nr:DUF3265 domain-containing protein [Vibrio alginolyticus]